MLDKHALPILQPFLQKTTVAIRKIKPDITPRQITLSAFACGVLGAVCIVGEYYTVGLLFILLSRLGDGLDGELARQSQQTSASGAYLDTVLDFIFYQSVVAAFGLSNPLYAQAAIVLMLCFMGTAASFLAFGIFAERFQLKSIQYPQKGFYYLGGLAEGTETLIFFALFCLFPRYFTLLAFVFALICIQTIIVRIVFGYKSIKQIDNAGMAKEPFE